MNKHDASPGQSRQLCDLTVASLQKALPSLVRKTAQNWCPLYDGEKHNIGYIRHSKDHIQIFFRFDLSSWAERLTALGFSVNNRSKPTSKPWEKRFCFDFDVYSTEQAELAAGAFLSMDQNASTLPEEVVEPILVEGATKQITINAYERSLKARADCIRKFGAVCIVCQVPLEQVYGAVATGFVHVHHLKRLADIGRQYRVNPATDLRPVCPNCHAIIHLKSPAYTIDEVQALIAGQRSKIDNNQSRKA